MAKAKNFSVIIVSDATSSSKSFSISSRLLHKAIAGASLLFLFFGFILFHYLTITLDKQKMKNLVRNDAKNRQTISKLNKEIEDLNRDLRILDQLKTKICIAAGLNSPESLRELGMGAPESDDDDSFNAQEQIVSPIPIRPQESTAPLITSKNLLKSYRQVDSVLVEQKLRLSATPSIAPVRGLLSSGFGYRIDPFTQSREFHRGLDISGQLGSKVIASADGIVLIAETKGSFGKAVMIDHGFGYTTIYCHLSTILVREGQKVRRREVVGLVGSTGRSIGPHLHYEVHYMNKALNPYYYILDWFTEF